MTGKQNIIQAFEYQPTQDWVPFWELEFHLWNAFSSRKAYFGKAFVSLSTKQKEFALHENAEIIAEVRLSLFEPLGRVDQRYRRV